MSSGASGKIWVTRSEPGAYRLAEALVDAGYEPWVRPVLSVGAIEPPTVERIVVPGDPETVDWIQFCTQPLPDAIVVLSGHALAGYENLLETRSELRRVPHVAIGEQTARELQHLGLPALHPEVPTSEGVLQLLQTRVRATDVIWLLTGAGGRGLLQDELAGQHCVVFKVACYQRQPAAVADLVPGLIAAVVVSSGAGLEVASRHWVNAGGLFDVPLIMPSSRTAKMALEIGFNNVHNAGSAAPREVVAVLDRLAAR